VKVYNLTAAEVTYKGRRIPPNGGCVDFKDLAFVPNRDLELQDAKVLAFGSLPHWWNVKEALKHTVSATVRKAGAHDRNGNVPQETVVVIAEAAVPVTDSAGVSMGTSSKKK
jgi:hypothetical protein